MTRRRLYLMRHGDVAYFEEGVPVPPHTVTLTPAGHAQAEAARDALAGVELDLVVSSDLARTVETARIVAGRDPERWPELREWEGGRLRDLPEEQLEQEFVGALRIEHDDGRFLGGESLAEVRARVLPALERLVARDWDAALAVLHGGVNRLVLSYALTGGARYLWNFEQAPACINVLDLAADHWIVRTVNYIPYDPLHPARETTMEALWRQYRGGAGEERP
ncbi:MAG TPA: histidine phosphatase family protein [Gaiellaceae bacterium]|nr:histidine phosphatase family protein [Gaiellaceae bacterium]